MPTANTMEITDALHVLLGGITGLTGGIADIGDTDAPDEVTAPPFIEVRQLPAGRNPPPDYSQALSMMYVNYQLLVVGNNRAQAQDFSARAMEAILEEQADHTGYVNAMPMTNHVVAGREFVSLIGDVDSGRSKAHVIHVRFLVHRTT